MQEYSAIRMKVERNGWQKVEIGATSQNTLSGLMMSMISGFGKPMPGRNGALIERLTPLSQSDANPASLSQKYGFREFPFHNDTAHFVVPYRYVVLGCVNEGNDDVPTWLLDTALAEFDLDEQRALNEGIFFVRNGKRSFYSSVLSRQRPFYRVDPGCMEPQNDQAHRALTALSSPRLSERSEKISWSTGTILILDNWRVLHRRGAITGADNKRVLLRCAAT